jgi:hypothetical protein
VEDDKRTVFGLETVSPEQPVSGDPPDGPGPVNRDTPARRRMPARAAALVGVLGLAFVAGLAAWGLSSNGDLTTQRATLTARETELASTKTTLDSTNAGAAKTSSELAAVSTDRSAREKQVADLSGQVAAETQCIDLQKAALAELHRISGLQTDNFNRTAVKSTWDAARLARDKAVSAALDDYYKAYSNAFQGRRSVASGYVSKGRTAQATITAQDRQMAAELALVDSSAAGISTAIDALETMLAETTRACAGVTE